MPLPQQKRCLHFSSESRVAFPDTCAPRIVKVSLLAQSVQPSFRVRPKPRGNCPYQYRRTAEACALRQEGLWRWRLRLELYHQLPLAGTYSHQEAGRAGWGVGAVFRVSVAWSDLHPQHLRTQTGFNHTLFAVACYETHRGHTLRLL